MKESERVSSSHKNFAKKYSSSSKNKYPTSGTYKAPSAMFQTHRKLTSTAASAVARFVSQQDLVRNSVFMFTDGSCLGNRNVATNNCPAGWGVVVVKFREEISARMAKLDTTVNVYEPQYLVSQLTKDKCDIVAELCGPVTVSTQNSTTAPLTRNDDANGDDLDNSIDVGK